MSEVDNTLALLPSPRWRRNWPLIVGSVLVAVVILLAVLGPSMAPKDPREQVLIIQIDGTWMTPAYPAFTPGYPLGSDNLGRDLYSWLLWSVRPTMVLVSIVGLLRLTLGLVIGMGAGWSERWVGRACDGLISVALAVPALIASLIVITAIGFRLGIWAFVVGLAVTGWAETAQLVREQTRTIKAQEAVEAARALGASGAQTFVLHVVPQVMPMIWMLMAFEISNTVVTTAGLGFLGYYLGGAVFTEVDDFVYQRISEMPELGQMLATAWMVLDEPWAMVAAGTVVFLIVLAFNLLGEGLQLRLTIALGGPRRFYRRLAGDVLPWIDEHAVLPVGALAQRRLVRVTAALVLVVTLGAGTIWMRAEKPAGDLPQATATGVATSSVSEPTVTPESEGPPENAFSVPGDPIWANQLGDPWGTRWFGFTGPITSAVQWSYSIDGGFSGGPAIDASGLLYIAARPEGEVPGELHVLDAGGQPVWITELADRPVGTPALDAENTIYVTDKSGMSAISPEGELVWRFEPEDGKPAMSGPLVGLDGTIYYKSLSGLVAVTPVGELRWQAPITETMSSLMPHLSADGDVIYWETFAFNGADGTLRPWREEGASPPQIVVGADGKQYRWYNVMLLEDIDHDAVSEEGTPGPRMVFDCREITWDGREVGVTPSGRPWLSARPTTGGMGLGFFWGAQDGQLHSKLNIPRLRNTQVVGVDRADTAYICMEPWEKAATCVAFGPDSDRALWRAQFSGVGAFSGAALAPGRLYVATWEGNLFAVGETVVKGAASEGASVCTGRLRFRSSFHALPYS